ncbi:protein-L-isoaspartate(D-aspartate) O-methyltransferase [Sediminimonas sp.]|uniref:protein-L-isoaspartate(D-aspartate) O-methyltransferase n=1 Tax=Sediminimonas sp. TaxID=2823379 RepID=UPI0025E419FB|nr:protein-L-isoaspartate(D-aspartate) O-methyltransferase [Sediminimonas sp.]
MTDFSEQRAQMVRRQIRARGVRDERLLNAMGMIPRERFLPARWQHLAYQDRPILIAGGQVALQPHVVAYMIEALVLAPGARVLELGTGTGYAAAILAEMGAQVYAIEASGQFAERAASTLVDLGYGSVHVQHASDLRAWQEEGPFDAILVSEAVAAVPEALKSQLKTGGRLVAAVGTSMVAEELVRVTRLEKGQFDREDLADIRFVPLLTDEGEPSGPPTARLVETRPRGRQTLPGLILNHAEVFDTVEEADLSPMMARIGDKRVVLIGEASHGTSEFYRMRARITQRLIEEKGFTIVAAEADWPDAAHIDTYVRHRAAPSAGWEAFARFPEWMWRNEETKEFADWLYRHNADRTAPEMAGFYGLDLYSLFASTRAIVDYLEDVDAGLAALARRRYACLSPWEADPAAYGHAALTGRYRDCEREVTQMLADLLKKRKDYTAHDGHRFLDAAQNAQLVADAERYYRVMYYGSRMSWNLRDGHMFDTLMNVMDFHGPQAKAVVWAHNSHIGDARATEMSRRGEKNLGEMCARGFGSDSYRIGFGTDHGEVAAASDWGGPMEIKQVQPAHRQSYERQFHLTGAPGLILPMRAGQEFDLVTELADQRLERAIGVIYRPETELASHYFEAELPAQFDEYVWIDRTTAVSALPVHRTAALPDTYPFGV